MIVDLDIYNYNNLKKLSEKLKMKDKNKEKILLARKSQLYEFCDLVNCASIKDNLTKLIGFFYIQQHLSHNLELYDKTDTKFLISQ